ncbi:hypothetical protein ABEB36_002409 [Hypothenemus hampei]|uniref:Gustatory receptor n=1 Tax=Hypothenemus hampei TaxID=57062 RepID=A0ABD1F5M6_HYPHA
MNKFVRYLNKTFIKCLRLLLITPKNQKKTCLLLVYAVVIVVLFTTSIYFRYEYDIERKSLGIIIIYSLHGVKELFACLTVLITLYTYRKVHIWQSLYKNVNILNEQQCHTILVFAFFVEVFLHFYSVILWNVLFRRSVNLFLSFLLVSSVTIHFFYNATLHTLLTSIILEMKRKLVIVNEHINSDFITMDVTDMYAFIYQAIEAGKIFNCLFGYQLLTFYFQWFVFLVINLLNTVVIINSEKYFIPSKLFEGVSIVTSNLIVTTVSWQIENSKWFNEY